jgi:hypothetical protein
MGYKLHERENQTMRTRRSSRYLFFAFFTTMLLLLSACQPAALTTSPQPTQPPAQPSATPATLVTQPPAQPSATPETVATQTPAQSSGEAPADITLDYSAVAQDVTAETVPAQPAKGARPAEPEYRRLTLQGYPVANHLHKPQIFVYPAGGLAAANENAGKTVTELQALLQTQQAGDQLPFLPPFNAAQVMHAQVQYLDFKSGKGVRFLTQFDQAPLPINNYELFYTFQGLSSDGKYYIAAVLPVTNPELPASSEVSEQQAETLNDFPNYISGVVSLLNQQPADSFTPDLNKLDALMGSIEVR